MDDKYSVSISWEDAAENETSNGVHTVAWFVDFSAAIEFAQKEYRHYTAWATFVHVEVRHRNAVVKAYTLLPSA